MQTPLPNLFLADLPPTLALTPGIIREACAAIRRNREHWLARKTTRELIELVAFTAERWCRPDDGFRQLALRDGPAETGFPGATLGRGLDAFFRLLTAENLEALVVQDLGDLRRLDDFISSVAEMRGGRSALARGPELLVHIAAGNLPNPALFGIVLGVLAKSAQFVKCATGASLLPRLFAHSLAHTESKLGACLELAVWPGGSAALEEALLGEANCVAATGTDETLASIRGRLSARTRFVPYGHRVSFGFVSHEMLSLYSVPRVVRGAASDITAWNQQGCLSPHVYYVQDDGVTSPEGFADQLAAELEAHEAKEPRGPLPVEEAAPIEARRSLYELRAAALTATIERNRRQSVFVDARSEVRLWQSGGSTAWTVVYDSDPRFELSCLNRFIYVKPVKKLADALRHAEPVRHQVSTVALAALDAHAVELARELAAWGVTRICPVGRMQDPPVAWRHDGRPSLGDLVTWTDFET
jgi:hypothetical protein